MTLDETEVLAAAHRFYAAIGAHEEGTKHFLLAADAIEWLAAEGA